MISNKCDVGWDMRAVYVHWIAEMCLVLLVTSCGMASLGVKIIVLLVAPDVDTVS